MDGIFERRQSEKLSEDPQESHSATTSPAQS